MDNQTYKINRFLTFGWLTITVILLLSYTLEVLKHEQTPAYLAVFIAVTFVPALINLIQFLRYPNSKWLRYEIVAGYMLMYIFVMFTGHTPLVFTYILPMLSLLILYHEPNLVIVTGLITILLNVANVIIRFRNGEITNSTSKEAEIQLALILLCLVGSYLATRLYDDINRKNEEYNAQLTEQNRLMKKMTMQTILTIANTIDAKDEYTKGHSRRVAEYSAAIAEEMKLDEETVNNIRSIGLLHDIGKIGVPDAVLNKPGRLTDEEFELMKDHTVIGADILKDIAMIPDLDIGAKYHHERYDGHGYPDGLSGENIPLIARIIAVADAYDAMSSNRIYRRHLPYEKILRELKDGSGKQWDPTCAQAMIRLMEEERLPKVIINEENDDIKETTTILTRVLDAAEDMSNSQDDLDELTGAFGRERGKRAIQEAIGRFGHGLLLLFDIDHFHRINDRKGFVSGDNYLKALVEMIHDTLPEVVVSRFGADEFVVYVPNYENFSDVEAKLKEFYAKIRNRCEEDHTLESMSVSIGATEISTEKDRFMVLYENATKALYVAKQNGGNTYYCHHSNLEADDPEYNSKAVDLTQLVEMVKNAEHYTGGMQTGYPEFGRMYEFVTSLASRNNQEVQIILFTMTNNPTCKITIEERDRIMLLLQRAIIHSIRSVDITTRYSSIQHVVLLMNLNQEQTNIVTNRIMTEFYRTYDKREVTIHYDTAVLPAKHLETYDESNRTTTE